MSERKEIRALRKLVNSHEVITIRTTLKHLDDALVQGMESGAFDCEPQEIQFDDDNIISLNGLSVQFPELGLEAYEGLMLTLNEDGEFEPDWGLTLIHKTGKPFSEGFYVEQDDISCSLMNYLNREKGICSEDTECVIAAAA